MQSAPDYAALFGFLGIKPGTGWTPPTDEARRAANRAYAARPMTIDRILNDCGIASSSAELGATLIGMGQMGGAARHFGLAFDLVEALIADGCAGIEGAEGVPVLSHQLAETCQAHGILDAAVSHAKRLAAKREDV